MSAGSSGRTVAAMHPFFAETMLRDNERELARRAARVRVTRVETAAPPRNRTGDPVTLRLARPHDAAALLRLTRLDSRPEPQGSYIIAEIDGEIVAAMQLPSGELVADPFRPTAHLVPLLELRAEQLTRSRLRRARFGLKLGSRYA